MKRDKYAHVCERDPPSWRERERETLDVYVFGRTRVCSVCVRVCVSVCCWLTHTRRRSNTYTYVERICTYIHTYIHMPADFFATAN